MLFRNLPGSANLGTREVARLTELVAEWQLLADLSFADLVLWVSTREQGAVSEEKYLAIAQIRPMTAATVFTQDLIGKSITAADSQSIDRAFKTGEIIRDSEPSQSGEFNVKEEAIPIRFDTRIIGVISRHRNLETMRTPSRLELNYREIANNLYRMISEGSFPIEDGGYQFESAPRVGDGLVRLDVDGSVIFASPNARSAFTRIGWGKDMEGQRLGEILEQLAVPLRGREPREENWRVKMSGKNLHRDEFENSDGILDLLVIPLTEGEFRIGAAVLVHNVTELRRRDRALVSKDATIREIHHRVKNNLQAVSALLRLQSRRTDEASAREAIEEAIRRIASIAHVHETLSTNSQNSVAFDEVISKILTSSLELSPRAKEIRFERKGEFGLIPSLIATPLALVLTELIQNALEHGVAEVGTKVILSVKREKANFQISVIDDGAGLAESFSLTENSSLGLEIVRTLTENELAGTLKIKRLPKGTEALIEFTLP